MTNFEGRELDVTTPSAARMYDYLLGGDHNYAIDRVKVGQLLEVLPEPILRGAARDNRRFMNRAVEFCMHAGIRQFLDIGSGIPTVGNVHEVAHAIDPATRVVYVDYDREAVVTAQEILQGVDTAKIIEADLRNPSSIMDHPDTQRLIDFTEPVGLLMVAVLHFVSRDDNAPSLVRAYTDPLSSGSYLAISHAAREGQEQWEHLYNDTSNPVTLRTLQEFRVFFDGFEIVEPGIVMAPDWPHPESDQHDSTRFGNRAAVGLKP